MKKFFLSISLLLVFSFFSLSPLLAGTATVRWQANQEPDLNGYKVYYGTSSRVYGPAVPLGKVTSHTLSNLTEGKTYFFSLTAVDTSGNESGYSSEVSKTIPASQASDTTDPLISITSPTSATTYSTSNPTVTLSGTASDNVGVTAVTWTNSAGGGGNASGTANWTASGIPLAQGQNVISVKATDAAGNEQTDTLTVAYSPTAADASSPSVSINSPTTRSRYSTSNSTLDLSGLAKDNNTVAKVIWSSSAGEGGVATGTSNWSIAGIPLSDRKTVITVTALDAAGNKGSRSLTVFYSKPRNKWFSSWSR